MSDRELLEAAAKAARLLVQKNVTVVDADDSLKGIKVRAAPEDRYREWNPLADDGDALRLAVACSLDIIVNQITVLAGDITPGSTWAKEECRDGVPEQRAAATRRAIVRAAARLGGLPDA